jgi:hypothetical protein
MVIGNQKIERRTYFEGFARRSSMRRFSSSTRLSMRPPNRVSESNRPSDPSPFSRRVEIRFSDRKVESARVRVPDRLCEAA